MKPLPSLGWGPRLLILAALIVAGCLPWPGLRYGFGALYSAFVSPVLEQVTFDGQASISMAPLPEDRPRIAGEHIVADTALLLKLSKYAGQMQVEVSLRRDVFLPLVLFGAMALVAPIPWRRRVATLGAGYALIACVAIGSQLLLLGNIFSGRLPLAPQLSEVYVVSDAWGATLQFLNERWLTPPGNRVIAPLLLGALAWAIHIDYWWPTLQLSSRRAERA
jgi:hypothetical protein